tara:strand:+ start:13151 stop:14311 length:1161 start_codon:yes stop_codon:yes gene_type:complete
MIAVIADDFTGAAEIGGLAFSFGYKVAIITNFKQVPEVDVLVVATDLRTFKAEVAAKESERITLKLLELNPELIYKKIDSVLRGNIGVELQSQMRISNKERALVIPANPLLNRIIRNGVYYIEDKPLIESFFSKDNSFKNKSSNVVEILQKDGVNNIVNLSHNEVLPKSGLIIGNVKNQQDLSRWVKKIDKNTVVSGASGFFGEIIKSRSSLKSTFNSNGFNKECKTIFICGSNFPLSKKAVVDAKKQGACVASMPDGIYFSQSVKPKLIDDWAIDIIKMFTNNNQVIVSVLQKPTEHSISSTDLKATLGKVVKKVIDKTTINEILIEGGSTAQSLVKALSFDIFFPIQAIAPGVTRMKIGNKDHISLTMKPGSYEWPKTIWKFDK